jgi:hypothetical protein
MTSYLRLLVFLIPINAFAQVEVEKVDHSKKQSTVIMEDVIVERTIIRTTKQNPKQETDNYDIDRDYFKNMSSTFPHLVPSLIQYILK